MGEMQGNVTVGTVEPGRIFQLRNGVAEFIKDSSGQIFQIVNIDHPKHRVIGREWPHLSAGTRIRVRARALSGYTIESA